MATPAYIVNCGPAGGSAAVSDPAASDGLAALAAFAAANDDTNQQALVAYVALTDPTIPTGDLNAGDAQAVNEANDGTVGD